VYKYAGKVKKAILLHIFSNLLSMILYLMSFGILGDNPGKAEHAAKASLWLTAVWLEMLAHFVATLLPGRAKYSGESVRERSGICFIIVLGTGESDRQHACPQTPII
jgi:hypothetical protein